MENRCLGCGALLQNTDISKIGYVQDGLLQTLFPDDSL